MLDGSAVCGALTRENLCEAAADTELLVNCTAAGMTGQPEFESLDFLGNMKLGTSVIDAVYNPLETRLLCRARELGLNAVSGLWMLVYQGALAFEWWTGILPDETACEAAFNTIAAD